MKKDKEKIFKIPRGTTVEYQLDFSQIPASVMTLSDVISVSMIIRYFQKNIDVSNKIIIDIDNNKIILPISQVDTFAFKAGEKIKIQTDVKYQTSASISEQVQRVREDTFEMEETFRTEVM